MCRAAAAVWKRSSSSEIAKVGTRIDSSAIGLFAVADMKVPGCETGSPAVDYSYPPKPFLKQFGILYTVLGCLNLVFVQGKACKLSKILVLYHSNSGNTQKMAELVAEGARQLEGTEVRLKDVSNADHNDLEWCDAIALGSPTNYGSVSWQMKQWWDQQR